jgi:hypothetical protein
MSSAIARKLESIQEKSAMRSVDVANLMGTRPETVSRWNQGKAFPRPEAQKLLTNFPISMKLLMSGSGCFRGKNFYKVKRPPS